MKTHITLLASVIVIAFTSGALAQATQDNQQHHPGAPATQAQPAPALPPATSAPGAPPSGSQMQMPMGQMMQGRMGQGGAMPGQMGSGGM